MMKKIIILSFLVVTVIGIYFFKSSNNQTTSPITENHTEHGTEVTESNASSSNPVPTQTKLASGTEIKSTNTAQITSKVTKKKYSDPSESRTPNLYSLKEFVDRAYGFAYEIPKDHPDYSPNSKSGCTHEYIQPTVERYKYDLTCVQSDTGIRFSSPYQFNITSYCADSSGFSGLVINLDESSKKVLCKDAAELMQSFDPNKPDLSRIESFKLPEFSQTYIPNQKEAEQYAKVKKQFGQSYGEGSYENTRFGYTLNVAAPYQAVIESGDRDIKTASDIELYTLLGTLSAQINVEVFDSANEIPLAEVSQKSKIKTKSGDTVFLTPDTSHPHSEGAIKETAYSFRKSKMYWSQNGKTSPLVITISTSHSTSYDEVNFAYSYKYHKFLEKLIIDSFVVNKKVLNSNR